MLEERQRQVEQDLDYLAPFLIQMGSTEKMSKWQALRLKEDCLNDFKHHLIDKANLIQARFEKVLTHFLFVHSFGLVSFALGPGNMWGSLFILQQVKKQHSFNISV